MKPGSEAQSKNPFTDHEGGGTQGSNPESQLPTAQLFFCVAWFPRVNFFCRVTGLFDGLDYSDGVRCSVGPTDAGTFLRSPFV